MLSSMKRSKEDISIGELQRLTNTKRNIQLSLLLHWILVPKVIIFLNFQCNEWRKLGFLPSELICKGQHNVGMLLSLALASVIRQKPCEGGSPHAKWWRETHHHHEGSAEILLQHRKQMVPHALHMHPGAVYKDRPQVGRSVTIVKIEKDKEEHSVVIVTALRLVPNY